MAVTGKGAFAGAVGTGASGETPASARAPRPHTLLLAACGLHALLTLALVPLSLPLGWDELVYASRFSPFGPATEFSAPRTRGVPLLVAPVASWSDSVVLFRAWLVVLSTAALYAGFLPWLRVLRRGPAVAVAAALYGTLWITSFYANSAMPNHYTAMGGVGAVGLFLWKRQSPLTRAGIAAWLALATLMRPNDGFALGLPLLLAALLVPAWRGAGRATAVLCGLAAGALPWAVEAYVRFGGVLQRLTEASEVQGDLRPLPVAAHHLTAMDGPLLCRPCTGDDLRVVAAEWWVLLPLLLAAGLWSLRRDRGATPAGGTRSGRRATPAGATRNDRKATSLRGTRDNPGTAPPRGTRDNPEAAPPRGPHAIGQAAPPQGPCHDQQDMPPQGPCHVLAILVGLAVALPYVFLVPYAAPRFLLPTYALLAPTAAVGLLAVAEGARAARIRRAAAVALCLVLVGHLAVQVTLVRGHARIQAAAREDWQRIAGVLHRHGVGGAAGPCVLAGNRSVIPVAHTAGCASGSLRDPHRPTALVMRRAAPPDWARTWPRQTVPDTYARGWVVHVRP
ncbi:hypothetical protein [Streptomyces alfalfae]|uniref:DUF2029 domain-containing protein n=1 Tax=Streptomyces alfalfae TaxID=1642299 RepID=A0A7T4PIS5_9ACTN|nr:hypothetical protein [Streptomyces alfalfae]QQC90819.1 hypothetical protein I8755_22225 [Streptomyces alfalfae]